MSREIAHAVMIIVTIVMAFLFSKTPLIQYDVQLSATVFALLYLSRHVAALLPFQRIIQPVGFTFVITTLIVSTGGLSSPFFFLMYFLLFSLSIFLEPVISITTTVVLVISFLTTIPENQDFQTLLPLFSLAFITPFAMFLGQEQRKIQSLESRIQSSEKDVFFFLSVTLKNHMKTIKDTVDNYRGDHDLDTIKKQTQRMEKLIDEFESKPPTTA
jgi:hypothetical protein